MRAMIVRAYAAFLAWLAHRSANRARLLLERERIERFDEAQRQSRSNSGNSMEGTNG